MDLKYKAMKDMLLLMICKQNTMSTRCLPFMYMIVFRSQYAQNEHAIFTVEKNRMDMTYIPALIPVIIILYWPIWGILKLRMLSTFRDSTEISGLSHVTLYSSMTYIVEIIPAFSQFEEIENYWCMVIFMFHHFFIESFLVQTNPPLLMILILRVLI